LSILLARLFDVSDFDLKSVVLIVGVLIGFFVVPRFGGDAYIRHSALRAQLHRAGVIPQRYSDFLDFAVGHIFLHKGGGGYRFVHDLLPDYLASLSDDEIALKPTRA